MKRIVMDTNVLVSALLKPSSDPARILRLVLQGDLELAVNEGILIEYEEILARPKFSLDPVPVRVVLDQLIDQGFRAPALARTLTLPDPGDEPFLEAAVAARVDALVTGNRRHFPQKACQGVRVVSPGVFVQGLGRGDAGN